MTTQQQQQPANSNSAAAPRITFCRKYMPLFTRDMPCRYYVVTGGRGSGKSFAISTAVCADHCSAPYNTLYLRQTLVSANVSIIPEFFEKLQLMGLADTVTKSNNDIKNLYTGWHIYFRGIQTSRGSNEAQLKSIKRIGLALVDEAQELVDDAAFDRIDFTLRDKGLRNRVMLSLNPTHKNIGYTGGFLGNAGLRMIFAALLAIPAISTPHTWITLRTLTGILSGWRKICTKTTLRNGAIYLWVFGLVIMRAHCGALP